VLAFAVACARSAARQQRRPEPVARVPDDVAAVARVFGDVAAVARVPGDVVAVAGREGPLDPERVPVRRDDLAPPELPM
jgi:hypothetical protein